MSNDNNNGATWWGSTTTSDSMTFTASANDTLTFTTSTDGSNYGNILSLTPNTTWDFLNNYEMWPKGVSDPSTEFKYVPKWHILLGYKNQMCSMWD